MRAHAAKRELPRGDAPLLPFEAGQEGEKQHQKDLHAFRRKQPIEIGKHNSVQAYPISARVDGAGFEAPSPLDVRREVDGMGQAPPWIRFHSCAFVFIRGPKSFGLSSRPTAGKTNQSS